MYSPASLLISVRGHREAEEASLVTLVHHGLVHVQVEAVDHGEAPGQLETEHNHPHCHWVLVSTGLTARVH